MGSDTFFVWGLDLAVSVAGYCKNECINMLKRSIVFGFPVSLKCPERICFRSASSNSGGGV